MTLLTIAMMFAMVPATNATTIAPGGSTTNLNPSSSGDLPTGSPLGSVSGTFTGAFTGTPSGTYTAQVFTNGNGFLSFVYNVSNTGTTDSVFSVSMSVFSGFTTDVFALPPGNSPVLGSRPGAGAVAFDFVGLGENNAVNPGQSSEELVVATNATAFGNGAFSLLGSGTATVLAFAPATPSGVPEPSTLSLLGIGLAATAGVTYRRRKAAHVPDKAGDA